METQLLFLWIFLASSGVRAFNDSNMCSNMTLKIDLLSDLDKGDPLKPYYDMAVLFIDAVHLNKQIDPGHIRLVIDYFTNATSFTFKDVFEAVKPLILDQIVFVFLLVIGCLFVVLFPLIGLIFCCCRLGGNCGGQKFQEKPSGCACIAMTSILVICVAVFVAGVTLYGVNNQRLFEEIKTAPLHVSVQTDHVISYMETVSNSLQCSIRESYEEGHDDLVNSTGHLDDEVNAVLMKVSGMQALIDLQIASERLNVLATKLGNDQTTLCNNGIQLNSDFQKFMTDFQSSPVGQGYKKITNLALVETEFRSTCGIGTIPGFSTSHNFTSETDQYVQELKKQTRDVQIKVNETLQQLAPTVIEEAISQIGNFTNTSIKGLVEVKNDVDVAVVQAKEALSVSWYKYLGLIIMAPILVITMCILLGLLCGLCTYSSTKAPFDRSVISECGGCCLMTSAGLMFIFGWLLMALTMVAFIVGYVGESGVCQPIFKNPSHQVWSLLPNITLDSASGIVLNVEDIVQGCRANEPIYQVLKLDAIVKLDEMVESVNNSFSSVRGKLDLDSLKGAKITYEIPPNLDPTKIQGDMVTAKLAFSGLSVLPDVSTATTELENVQNYLKGSTDPNSEAYRTNGAALLNKIAQFRNQMKAMQAMSPEGVNLTNQIRISVQAIPQQTDQTTLVTQAIANETDHLQTMVQSLINGVLESMSRSVRNSGPCRPLYDIFENVGTLLCHRVLSPLQAFWFSLGWCVVFFIPATICGIKLAKYFRRMDGNYYGNAVRDSSTRWNTNNMEMPARKAWM